MITLLLAELLEVRTPGHYEPEAWYMTDQEKEESVGTLHEQGNKLYANRDYTTAAEKYSAALGRLEMLMNKYVTLKLFLLAFHFLNGTNEE